MSSPKTTFLDKVLGRIGRLDARGLQTVIQRLARERRFLETLFNTIEDGVLVVDEKGRAIGILDESDLLVKVHRDPAHFNDLVKNAMTDRLETLSPKAKINDLLGVFDRGRVAIVMEDDKFLGLITRTDLLSYLRLHMPKSSVPVSREYS